jgi:hypothetical protein
MNDAFKITIFYGMKFLCRICVLVLLCAAFCGCSGGKKEPSQMAVKSGSEGSSVAVKENDFTPRDSIIQSVFSDGYAMHVIVKVVGPERLLIYNGKGLTDLTDDKRWYPDLRHGLFPLEPEWPDYFLVHEDNTGNCCTCAAEYLLKVTADEIKIIGLVN